MKITEIKTYLMNAGVQGGGWTKRNWLFVKIFTDEGVYGVGEASGWPRVVETAIRDLSEILVGEDPMQIERLWQKMFIAMMGHGMTGIVGGGALTGIEMALWDIKGKALGVPVYSLLGGKIRDSIRCYAHASTPDRALELMERGFSGVKTGGVIGAAAEGACHPRGGGPRARHHGRCPRPALAHRRRRDFAGQGAGGVRALLLRGPGGA